MVEFRKEGIYCPQADVYIDPLLPVQKAIITHGHSDHSRAGMHHYLCHTLSQNILRLRLGTDISLQTLDYGQQIYINGVKVSLHPAGHIIGSSQVRLEYKGEVWVASGDYKLLDDGVSTPFESVRCNSFITESTFGLPIYDFPAIQVVYDDINAWWRANAAEGYNTVIIGYSLGKAQNILRHLNEDIGPIFVHGAVAKVNEAYASSGIYFPGSHLSSDTDTDVLRSAAIVAPMSVMGSTWLRKLQPYRIAVCSGWMQLRGARRRSGVHKGFVLSDHADWRQLNEAVLATSAENVYVTHGYQAIYSRWLSEELGLNGLQTSFAPYSDADEEWEGAV